MNNIVKDILTEWKDFCVESRTHIEKSNLINEKCKRCLYKSYILNKRNRNISNYLLRYGHLRLDTSGIRNSLRKSIVKDENIDFKDNSKDRSNEIYLEDVVLKLNDGSKKRMKLYNEKSFSLSKKEDVKDVSAVKELLVKHKKLKVEEKPKNEMLVNEEKDSSVEEIKNNVIDTNKELKAVPEICVKENRDCIAKDNDIQNLKEDKIDVVAKMDILNDNKENYLPGKDNTNNSVKEIPLQEDIKIKEEVFENIDVKNDMPLQNDNDNKKEVYLDSQTKLSMLDISMVQKPKTSIFNEKYKEIKKFKVKNSDLKKENERINFLFKIAKKEIVKKNQTLMMSKPKPNKQLEVSKLKTLFLRENNVRIDSKVADLLPEKKIKQNVDLIYDVKTSQYIYDDKIKQNCEIQENKTNTIISSKKSEITTKDSLELSKLPHKKKNKDGLGTSSRNDLYRQVIDNERIRHKNKQIEYKASTVIPYIKSDDEDDILHIEPDFVKNENLNEIVMKQDHEEIEKYFNCGLNVDIVLLFPNIKDVSNDSPNKWV